MLKKALNEWIKKIGPNEVKARLVKRGIGASTVEKLVAGTYEHEPKGTTAAALSEEMVKDGISINGIAS